ncbi:MAG: hypothetical protein WA705_00500 [Candidatus Ozemobacteraceae bacterium]
MTVYPNVSGLTRPIAILSVFLGMQTLPVGACTPIPYLFELFCANSPVMAAVSLLRVGSGSGISLIGLENPGRLGESPALLTLSSLLFVLAFLALVKALFIRGKMAVHGYSFWRTLGAVVWANIVSTLVSFVFMLGFVVPMLFPFTFFLGFVLMAPASRLLQESYAPDRWWMRYPILLLLGFSSLILAIWLFHAKTIIVSDSPNMWWYWFHKIGFCIFAIATGLFTTTAIEAKSICGICPVQDDDRKTFFQLVLRYNSYALLILFLIAAGIALPLRLANPEFLL